MLKKRCCDFGICFQFVPKLKFCMLTCVLKYFQLLFDFLLIWKKHEKHIHWPMESPCGKFKSGLNEKQERTNIGRKTSLVSNHTLQSQLNICFVLATYECTWKTEWETQCQSVFIFCGNFCKNNSDRYDQYQNRHVEWATKYFFVLFCKWQYSSTVFTTIFDFKIWNVWLSCFSKIINTKKC